MIRLFVRSGLAAVLAFVASRSSAAQLPIPSFELAGGVAHYSSSSTNSSSPFGAVRIDLPIASLLVEGSFGVSRLEDGTTTTTISTTEAQLQWQLFPTVVRPYFGLGGGFVNQLTSFHLTHDNATISAAAGIRVGVPVIGLGLRGEVRVRTIGFSANRGAEFTLGASW